MTPRIMATIVIAILLACSTRTVLLSASPGRPRPFQHRFSTGPVDLSSDGCGQILSEDLRAFLPRIDNANADLRYEELWNPSVYSDLNASGGFAYESDSWPRLAVVNAFRWYSDHPGFTSMPEKSDLRAVYVTLDAEGFGESFYYYSSGLPILAVQRRTTFHVSYFDDDFDPLEKSTSEHWFAFRHGSLIAQCLQRDGAKESVELSEEKVAQVYADALFYKTLRTSGLGEGGPTSDR